MTTVLVPTASVHTTAAACDYLEGRLDTADTVLVLTVDEPGLAPRDAGDAANVARARLAGTAVESLRREGSPAEAILAVASERGVDVVVLGATGGGPDSDSDPPGETVRAVLAGTDRPVTVLPTGTG